VIAVLPAWIFHKLKQGSVGKALFRFGVFLPGLWQ
jgi:hypothetical protein